MLWCPCSWSCGVEGEECRPRELEGWHLSSVCGSASIGKNFSKKAALCDGCPLCRTWARHPGRTLDDHSAVLLQSEKTVNRALVPTLNLAAWPHPSLGLGARRSGRSAVLTVPRDGLYRSKGKPFGILKRLWPGRGSGTFDSSLSP